MKNIVLCFLLLVYTVTWAQETIHMANKHIIASKSLHTDREIWVSLPDSYTNTQFQPVVYPVIYVLDAEANFMHHSAVVQKFQSGNYPRIAESIVVGITNKNGDRTKDFTPINDAAFTLFIQDELFPFIQSTYRTNEFKVLIGHSLGGLFALTKLYTTPEMFNAYVAHDPSLWYNDKELLKLYQANDQPNYKKRFVMMTQVGEQEVTESLRDHYESIKAMNRILRQQPTLHYSYKHYENEDHGSVPMIGTIDFLRWLYAGYSVNIKKIKDQPELIDQTFKAFSQKMNTPFLPSESYLQLVAKYMVRIKEYDLAEYYFHQRYSLFPNSEQAQKDLTDFCQSNSPNSIK